MALTVGSIVVARDAVGNIQVVVTKVNETAKGSLYTVKARFGSSNVLKNTYFRDCDKYEVIEPAAATPATADKEATLRSGGVVVAEVEDACKVCSKPTVNSNGGPLKNVLLCEDCEAEVHLRCSSLKVMPPDDEPFHCEQCASKKKAGAVSSTLVALGVEDEVTMVATVVVARSTETTAVVVDGSLPTLEIYRRFKMQGDKQHASSSRALDRECESLCYFASWSQPLEATVQIPAYDEETRLMYIKQHFAKSIEDKDPTAIAHLITHMFRAAACNGDPATRLFSAEDLLLGSVAVRIAPLGECIECETAMWILMRLEAVLHLRAGTGTCGVGGGAAE